MSSAENDAGTATPREENARVSPQQARLRALGHAASTVAHDIDIALAPITLYTDALLDRELLSDRARHYVTGIRRAVDDLTNTVGRLRDLDRLNEPETHAPADTLLNIVAPSNLRSLRVLLIDDDPSLIDAMRSALTDEGHKVIAASGGESGIDAFRRAHSAGMPFDIVITDLAMPDVDGRQVIAGLRAISPGTPIIMLTGWRHQLTSGVERPLKVDRLLGKPPRIRELRQALAELTGRRATDRFAQQDRATSGS